MNEKYNGIDNLDYTIELDGDEYNLTAADSAWADIARKTTGTLTIETSDEIDGNDVIFNGSENKNISVVPSTGGRYTGSIKIPDHGEIVDEDKGPYAMNRNGIEGLLAHIKGFPTYEWIDDGTPDGSLDEVNSPSDSDVLSAFKIVIYNSDSFPVFTQEDYAPDSFATSFKDTNKYEDGGYTRVSGVSESGPSIHFKDENGNNIDCYFLAINKYNGWIAAGHCYTNGTVNYQPLFVLRAAIADQSDYSYQAIHAEQSDKASSIVKLNEDGNIDVYKGTSVKKDYSFDDLFALSQLVYGDYNIDKDGNYVDKDNKPGLYRKDNGLDNKVKALEEAGNSHINTKIIHRQIFYGTDDVVNYSFPTNPPPDLGDIYIKYSSQ